jgi:chromosome segregation ATPase
MKRYGLYYQKGFEVAKEGDWAKYEEALNEINLYKEHVSLLEEHCRLLEEDLEEALKEINSIREML